MKLHYISTAEEHQQSYKLFSSSHYIDLPNGKILMAAEFGDDKTSEAKWRNRVNVLAFPHPLSGKKIGYEIAQHLEHLGITSEHTTFEAAQIAAKIHPELNIYA